MGKIAVLLFLLLATFSPHASAQFFNGTANRIVKGDGPPSAGQCNDSIDVGKVYADRQAEAANSTYYGCANTSVGVYAWELFGGGGGGGGTYGSMIACTAVNWTGSVSVNWATAGPAGVPCNYLVATLTGNTTVSGFSNGPSAVYVMVKMNGTPRTLAYGGTIGTNIPACPASTVANSFTAQAFLYDGTNWDGNGCISTDPSIPNFLLSSTGNDTYAGTLSGPLAALSNGVTVVLKADTANTGAATLNVTGLGGSALGAVSILTRSGGALSNGDITVNQPITLVYNSTGPSWTIQGDGVGGGNAPVNSTTAGNGLYYPFGACVDCVSAALIYTANEGAGAQFINPTVWTSRYAQLTIGATASGTGCTGGTCGLVMGIFSADTATAVCVTETGTSGNGTARRDINNDFSQLALAWSTGSAVSGGVCTLPSGVYWFFYSSDSVALSGLGMATAFALEGMNAVNVKWGYMNAMTTGNGGSIAFTAGPYSLTTNTGLGHKLVQVILEN